MIEDLGPRLCLAGGSLPLAGLVDAIGVRADDPRFDQLLAGAPVAGGHAGGSDIAVVLFTSGSTGHPKGVLHSHRGLAYKAHSMVRAHGLTSDDVALMPSPLAHVSGLLNSVLVPGAAGMAVVLMEKWDAQRGVSLAADQQLGEIALNLGQAGIDRQRTAQEPEAIGVIHVAAVLILTPADRREPVPELPGLNHVVIACVLSAHRPDLLTGGGRNRVLRQKRRRNQQECE